jgi:hypothetical protein
MATFIYFLYMGLWVLWVYGLQEWADSTLFTISICILSGVIPLGVWTRVLASVG